MKYIRLHKKNPHEEGQWMHWGNIDALDDLLLNQMDDLEKKAQSCMPEMPQKLAIRASTLGHIRNHFNNKQKAQKPAAQLYRLLRYPLLAAASISIFFMFILAQDEASGNTTPNMRSTFADTVHSLHQSLNPQEDSIRDRLMLDVN